MNDGHRNNNIVENTECGHKIEREVEEGDEGNGREESDMCKVRIDTEDVGGEIKDKNVGREDDERNGGRFGREDYNNMIESDSNGSGDAGMHVGRFGIEDNVDRGAWRWRCCYSQATE